MSDGLAAMCYCVFWLWVWPSKSLIPDLTQCAIGPHRCTCQMASVSIERFKHVAWMWQTDHTVENCVGIFCALVTSFRLKGHGGMTTHCWLGVGVYSLVDIFDFWFLCVCLIRNHSIRWIGLVLIAPTHSGMARLSWLRGLWFSWYLMCLFARNSEWIVSGALVSAEVLC